MSEPKIITEADIDPGHNWKKALQAPGVMAVDFEERINFQRLHRYRLARTRQALRNSELGAVLCFDANNIRYMTSTNIGEWSRDKMCRSSLLAGNSLPHQWDFGSAAAHHRLHAPWIPPAHFHAVMRACATPCRPIHHAQLRARDPRHHEGQRRRRSAARHRHRRATFAA
jgi:Xaa-Pro dipeptidase